MHSDTGNSDAILLLLFILSVITQRGREILYFLPLWFIFSSHLKHSRLLSVFSTLCEILKPIWRDDDVKWVEMWFVASWWNFFESWKNTQKEILNICLCSYWVHIIHCVGRWFLRTWGCIFLFCFVSETYVWVDLRK